MSGGGGGGGGGGRTDRPRRTGGVVGFGPMAPHLGGTRRQSSSTAPLPQHPDLVSLATSCGARHISLRALAPSYGMWPAAHGGVAASHPVFPGASVSAGFVPAFGHCNASSFIPPAVTPCNLYTLSSSVTTPLCVSPVPVPSANSAGVVSMYGGLLNPQLADLAYGGYYQSLLHGISGNVCTQQVQDATPSSSSISLTSSVSGNEPLSVPLGNAGYVEALIDSDDDEVYGGNEDDQCSGAESECEEEEEEAVESDDDDKDEDAPSVPVKDVQDPSMKYEIFATPVGDCGCVSSGSKPKKRIRWPKGVDPPDCRQARGIGSIEKAMRSSKYRTGPYIFEPVLGMVFDSRAEAYQFFNLYSWEVGFGIRFGTSARNRVNKYRTMQEIVCEKEGFDYRCTSTSKRNHCKAMLRLHRSQDHGWYVSKHVAEHNHDLSVSCGEKREWNSHSKIEQTVKDMIRYLRENNVSLSRVHCFMGSMFGSMQNIPFNRKSLRAVCAEIARDHKDHDVEKTLEVFRQMRSEDNGFQFSVDLDEHKRIKTLLWTSGRSRSQYNFFGDAITFDTTYCTNLYKMPFGMFVGVNNHFQSVLFAGVLMRDETTESFKWVFNEFITLMGGKAPMTILTDQCKAMTKAVREVMTSTEHLWCKWHIFKDAPEELGPVYRLNGPFRREFHFVINQMLTEDEFERAWADLLDRYNLKEHAFMEKVYAKKKMWAKPWCKDIFCARMASTQRSESANSILKKVIPRNCSMNRFVQQYRKLLFIRASAEETAEHKTKQIEERGKRVYAIEDHASSIYTKKVFKMFSEEVDKSAAYNVGQGDSFDEVRVVHHNEEKRKKWARAVFKVKINKEEGKLVCECGMYEHFGILCCHSIKVLIHCGVGKIPEAHIMKRWTRDAKDFAYQNDAMSSLIDSQLRNNVLFANALEVVNAAQNDSETCGILMNYLDIAKKEIQQLLAQRKKDVVNNVTSGYSSAAPTEDGSDGETGYDTECSNVNTYGAAGSSAYMSDADIQSMQAPIVRNPAGRPREKRFPRMFEKFRKGKKRNSTEDGGYCDRCDVEGHTSNTCKLKANGKRTVKKVAAARKR